MARMLLKHAVLSMLPDVVLQPLRRMHYLRRLREGVHEPEMELIPHLLPRGGCAVDLGANFGAYTRVLADIVGPAGEVHAVEPVPASYDALRYGVRKLGLSWVKLYQVAVSDHSTFGTMIIPRYARGGENLYEARLGPADAIGAAHRIPVSLRTLDELFGRLPRMDFVKCDVEGHEWSVLRGASAILDKHRPSWLMEVSGNPADPDSSAAQVVELMARHGYVMLAIDGTDTQRTANYFFVQPEQAARITGQGGIPRIRPVQACLRTVHGP